MKKIIVLMITVWILVSGFSVLAESNIDIGMGVVHLNTKDDYLNLKQHFSSKVWIAEFQVLLDERKNWLNTGKLAKGEAGVIDETHKVIELKDEITNEVKERYQYKYQEDPNCKLSRLGFTVEEVEEILKTQGPK